MGFTPPPPQKKTNLHHRATGLGKGGQQIQSCRKAYVSAIQLLVQLANLQTAFLTLDVALKVTNRRVNALENVVKPKIENTISYIKVCGGVCARVVLWSSCVDWLAARVRVHCCGRACMCRCVRVCMCACVRARANS
jgi:hypothetical protein